MRYVLAALLSVFFACPSAAVAQTSEADARMQIIAAAESDFLNERFGALSDAAHTYAQSKSRTSSGAWKLTLFYQGIRAAIEQRIADKGVGPGYSELEASAAKWAAQYPRSPAAHITMSIIEYSHAWDIRGAGVASSVDPALWAPYRRHLEAARNTLEAHRDVASVDPEWYNAMIRVANGQGWKRQRFDALMEEALDREPLYYANYFSALVYLLPQWHGSIEQIDLFVRAAVTRTAKWEGRGMYARLYWYAAQREYDNQLFVASLARWYKMREGFEDIVARYPDAWNLSHYAKFACISGDVTTVRMLLPRIEDTPVPQAWDPPELRAQCTSFAERDKDIITH